MKRTDYDASRRIKHDMLEGWVAQAMQQGEPLMALSCLVEGWHDLVEAGHLKKQAAEWARDALKAANGNVRLFNRVYLSGRGNFQEAVTAAASTLFWQDAVDHYRKMQRGTAPEDVYSIIETDLMLAGVAPRQPVKHRPEHYTIAADKHDTQTIRDALLAATMGQPISHAHRALMKDTLDGVMEPLLARGSAGRPAQGVHL